jgi:general nucleoside transport system permease protein
MKRNIGVALLVVSGLVLLYFALTVNDAKPLAAIQALIKGSLGSPKAISDTLEATTPLLIAGIAVYLALQAGLFNIGVEGQFALGACASAVVALKVPGMLGVLLALIGGAMAGAVWALPAGWIKAYRGGHEVITTIMLNSVAAFFTRALVSGPIKDPTADGTTTPFLAEGSAMPPLYSNGPVSISSALLIAMLGAAYLAFWLRKSVRGYELRAVGANPTAAANAGIDTRKVTLKALALSGAIGGFGGAVQVLAFEHRFYDGISSGYGFEAIGIALLAGPLAIGLLPAAFLFGILAKGGNSLQLEGVPKSITMVVLGVLVIVAAALRYRKVKAVES